VAIAVAADVVRNDPVDDTEWTGDMTLGVYEEDGLLIAGAGPNQGGSAVADALTGEPGSETDGGHLVVAVPVTHDTDVIGAVRAAAPHGIVVQRVALVWVAMAALAGTVTAAVWLSRATAGTPARLPTGGPVAGRPQAW